MKIRIRTAKQVQHKDILKIALKSPYTKEFGLIWISSADAYQKGWIRIAKIKDEIVGFTCVRHKVREPKTVLYFMGVSEEWHRNGIGKALLEDVVEQSPHRIIYLKCHQDNKGTLKFYKNSGFKKKELVDQKYWLFEVTKA